MVLLLLLLMTMMMIMMGRAPLCSLPKSITTSTSNGVVTVMVLMRVKVVEMMMVMI